MAFFSDIQASGITDEAWNRQILDGAIDYAIIATDRSGRILRWSAGAEHVLGWTEREMLGNTVDRAFTPEDRALGQPNKEMQQALISGRGADERWHLRKSGQRFWASGEMTVIRDEKGNALGFVKVLRDRTETHQAQRALLEAQENLRRATEIGGIGVFSVDILADVLYPSPLFCRLYGLTEREQYPASVIEKRVIAEDREWVSTAASRSAGQAIREVQYRIRRSDTGELRWISRTGEIKCDERGQPVVFAGVARDVTEERKARLVLEQSAIQAREFAAERQFVTELATAQRASNDPVQIMRRAAESIGRKFGAHRVGFYRLAGTRTLRYVADWTDGTIRSLAGEMPADAFGLRVEQARRSGETLAFSDSQHDPKGGLEEFWEQGVLAGICLSIHDQNRWLGGFYIHHAAVRAWTAAEVDLAREVAELTWLAVERAEALIRLEHRVGEQDSTISRVAEELHAEAASRVMAEEQLRQLQKMEAVGQLTGGIAHDFNNMLAVIIGGLNLLQRRLARGETDLSKYVDAALDGATRAAALTQRLLAFARQQPLAPEPLDANRLLSDLSDLLRRTLGEQIHLETVLSAGVWRIKADANQLENVIINLATNARDAMPEGGKMTIETINAHVDKAYAREYQMDPGQYLLIGVSDTGIGMPREVVSRAFDPFFTTKGPGKGTGLGLSQVFGFIRQSGGHVKIYSEVGHGTVIKLYLPRYLGDAPTPAPRPLQAPVRAGRPTEIVMVVEDEERVRALSVEALRELGYTVLHAANGAAALQMIEAGQDVTLLFTDIVMPEMTGRHLADRALKHLPELKVVYTTGYTRNAVVHNGVIDPGTHFLAKPFSLEQLAEIVREAMDESR